MGGVIPKQNWREHVRLVDSFPQHPLFPDGYDVMCVDPITHNYRYLYSVRFIEAEPMSAEDTLPSPSRS